MLLQGKTVCNKDLFLSVKQTFLFQAYLILRYTQLHA